MLVGTNLGKYGGLTRPGNGIFVQYKAETGQIFYALYAHAENMKPVGTCMKRGEQLATVGHYYQKSGADGPHLHFGVFFGNGLPSGNGWPWRQYIADPSQNPGWQDPVSVLHNLRPGAPTCRPSQTKYPEGDTILLEAQGGPIRVNNFYKSVKFESPETARVALEKTAGYVIWYTAEQNMFEIELSETATKADQISGEQTLLKDLGVTKPNFCKLSVSVTSLEDKITGSRASTPPSFCPDGQLHFIR